MGGVTVERTLEWLVNDGLMVIFFFVVGLKIRREMHHGELSELRRAALPLVAALGGMLAPALLYTSVASGGETRVGWGVPMATDIAFAIGVLSLLGSRVPPALRVLLLALAVIDDLGAIIVIALFYSTGIEGSGLLVAGVGIASIFIFQRLGVRAKAAYVFPGLVVWAGIASAGVHPTIAGVIIGLMTPVRAWLGPTGFFEGMQHEMKELADASTEAASRELAKASRHVAIARREALSPAESLIEMLHPWVAFGVMPIFALANAGVPLTGFSVEDVDSMRVLGGVSLGLVLGKPLGVMVACGVALRLRVATLPAGLGTGHPAVLGTVAGIGFTMSMFIAQLAFVNASHLGAAKLGVLAASGISSVVALVLGRVALSPVVLTAAALTADEAESSTTK